MIKHLLFTLPAILLLFTLTEAQPQTIDASHDTEPIDTNDRLHQAVRVLEDLEQNVVVYQRLSDFQEGNKLSTTSPIAFQRQLAQATATVGDLTRTLPNGKAKTAIHNTIASYRDGLYWWTQIDERRVISVSQLQSTESYHTQSDLFLKKNLPYLVAVHWRQANKYLTRAKQLIETESKTELTQNNIKARTPNYKTINLLTSTP